MCSRGLATLTSHWGGEEQTTAWAKLADHPLFLIFRDSGGRGTKR